MKLTKTLTAIAVALAATTSAASALDELVVAYFLEWPTPNQFAQQNELYEEVLGVPVKWVSFDAGTAMSAAMASGDVHISYSQGVTPFLVATAAGQNLKAVDVSATYSDNDNCVVRAGLEIDKDNAGAELPGKQVGVPLGTASHSGFLAQMKHFGVDIASLKIVDMAPVDSAAAFAAGNLDMACGWSGPLQRMKQHGNVLLEGAEKDAVVGRVFDLVTIPAEFGEENREIIEKFLAVNIKMETMYRADKEPMLAAMSKASGMDMEGLKTTIAEFRYSTPEEKLSSYWFDGGVVKHLTGGAAALEEAGQITALKDYAPLVDSSFYEAASKIDLN